VGARDGEDGLTVRLDEDDREGAGATLGRLGMLLRWRETDGLGLRGAEDTLELDDEEDGCGDVRVRLELQSAGSIKTIVA